MKNKTNIITNRVVEKITEGEWIVGKGGVVLHVWEGGVVLNDRRKN